MEMIEKEQQDINNQKTNIVGLFTKKNKLFLVLFLILNCFSCRTVFKSQDLSQHFTLHKENFSNVISEIIKIDSVRACPKFCV